MNIDKVREDFPITRDRVYLNIANHSPPSKPVQGAIRELLLDWDRLERNGDRRVREACDSFARLINASPEEIACQPNTSQGLTTIAETLPLKRGENIVVSDLENPANIYPWLAQRRRGVEIRIVPGVGGAIRSGDLEDAVDDSTRVLAVSHVQWLTGARSDLKLFANIAHDHGAYFVVDAIQAAGAVSVDIRRDNVDFLACGSYKWLLGPSGAGFLYARGDLIEDLQPPFWGYRSVDRHSLDEPGFKNNAQRLELGEPSYLSFVGTKAGIDHILSLGVEEVEQQVLRLSGLLHEGLRELGVEVVSPSEEGARSGVVSFRAKDTRVLYEGLVDAGFVISLRPLGIRVSPGFYNTQEEIEGLLEQIGEGL
ncbi:MAG: aminotransferase class V-fold PLP-dependent enzyme [Candidatus Bathyarchaeota archaeon]|jgi:selenocysteine lyase/cysteine desulfurase